MQIGFPIVVSEENHGNVQVVKQPCPRRIILFHQRIPLMVCGTETIAETDVCIQNNGNILLLLQGYHPHYEALLQEDKVYGTHLDPEPQLIAPFS